MQTPKNKNAKSIQNWVLLLLLSGAMPMARADDAPGQGVSPPLTVSQESTLPPASYQPVPLYEPPSFGVPQGAVDLGGSPNIMFNAPVSQPVLEQSLQPTDQFPQAVPAPQTLNPASILNQFGGNLPSPANSDQPNDSPKSSWQNLWLVRQTEAPPDLKAVQGQIKQDDPKGVWKPYGDEDSDDQKSEKQELFDPTSTDHDTETLQAVPAQNQN